jgi:hypothetical protein
MGYRGQVRRDRRKMRSDGCQLRGFSGQMRGHGDGGSVCGARRQMRCSSGALRRHRRGTQIDRGQVRGQSVQGLIV